MPSYVGYLAGISASWLTAISLYQSATGEMPKIQANGSSRPVAVIEPSEIPAR
jgi:hypothetical protein